MAAGLARPEAISQMRRAIREIAWRREQEKAERMGRAALHGARRLVLLGDAVRAMAMGSTGRLPGKLNKLGSIR